MRVQPKLRIPAQAAEKAINHFYNKGDQFHLITTTGPRLEEDLKLFIEWAVEVCEFLKGAFTTPAIADNFRAIVRVIEVRSDNAEYSSAVRTCVRRTVDFLDNLRNTLSLYEIANPATPSALEILHRICSRFDSAVRQLRNRYDNRPTLNVEDEHDLQYLLHPILRIFFDDIRPEEYVPSFAGAASRIDFLLKNEQMLFEVKMSRPTLTSKKLGEELIVDIERYKVHPDCKLLYCFVYDPEHYINNPQGIETDLSRSDGLFPVKVFIAPK